MTPFHSHDIRTTQSLNGLWDFAWLGKADVDSFVPGNTTVWEKMPVPGAFDALPGYTGKRGAAVYRTHLSVPAGYRARIAWGAISIWCRIYADGELLDEHACGYSPFFTDLPASNLTERELTVLVDNRFDFDRAPMHEGYFDFYQYGGILRDVTLHLLPAQGPYIERVQVTPTAAYDCGKVDIAVILGGDLSTPVSLSLQFDDDEALSPETKPLSEDTAHYQLAVPNSRTWSPQSPHLHRLRVRLQSLAGKDTDDMNVRFGLRGIEAREGILRLNGEKLLLRGYNRHEWHPNYGPCTPVLQMVSDLQLMKDLGCNFVRGSHYPQDQRFLDLCDEYGFLVWEENLGWGQREKTFSSTKWREDHAKSLREMVAASYNHPSVIIWGFLNEAGTDHDYVRPVFEETVTTLRALDPSRLISYASMYPVTDKHYDLADVIGINIYPGWYDCEGVEEPLELIAPRLRECLEHIDRAGFVDKPIFVSEIGAEGLYGWHDAHEDFFSEAHQAEYLRRACEAALTHSRCSGIALWQFTDVRTYGGGYSLRRPRTYNNKGTLDEFRRPKMAYRAVREAFQRAEARLSASKTS